MAEFTKRQLRGHGTLGERLKKIREDRGEDLSLVASHLRIQPKYLAAIEAGNYLVLPGEVYVKNFLRQYAKYLDVNPDTVIHLYKRESGVFRPQQKRTAQKDLEQGKNLPKAFLTPRVLRKAFVVMIILGIIVYLGFETQRIIKPPEIVIFFPPDNLRIIERSVTIRGETEPEALIHINNEEVIPDELGAFEEEVELQEGLNTLIITAKKPRSAEQEVIRTVLVEKGGGE
ncbi:helix-turn-helix domain-containing protein [Patescibacteria group bacterium]